MDSELQYFQDMVDEIRETAGIKQPIEATRYPIIEEVMSGPCNPGADPIGSRIAIPHGFRKCGFDKGELKAVLAHEVGHIAHAHEYGKINPLEAERQADQFAGEHGFAKDSIRALSTLDSKFDTENDSHPRSSERIKNFQRFL